MPDHSRRSFVLVVFALFTVLVAAVALGRGEEDVGGAAAAATASTTSPPVTAGVVTVRKGGGSIFDAPGAPPGPRLAAGLVMGFDAREGDLLRVVTPCDEAAWISTASVDITPRAAPLEDDRPDPGSLVVVLDPGHGGAVPGAIGPSGLVEAVVNLDIAERARVLLTDSHTVDWEAGAVGPGTSVPAFGRVILTRSIGGPEGGDHELGLAHRAAVAGGAGAHALVSIHNNANHRGPLAEPGSEVFYRVGDAESGRLAGLVHEELVRSFRPFDADWQGAVPGPMARVDAETGADFYGLLRLSKGPAVIAEGLYLTNPDEEALLTRAEVRHAYAEALYRALVRFFLTDDTGTALGGPVPYASDDGAVASECELPLHQGS
ncbi:MAG: N-acetylmuramoyl-L-alanine amidase [Acidimicrobiia bacterium]|jgi:N-acetylmuramoyl-L-alanine amidase